jgi:hypothetical protein
MFPCSIIMQQKQLKFQQRIMIFMMLYVEWPFNREMQQNEELTEFLRNVNSNKKKMSKQATYFKLRLSSYHL